MNEEDLNTLVILVGLFVAVQWLRSSAYAGNRVPALAPQAPPQTPAGKLLQILVPMNVSPEGQAFIRSFEQLRLNRYNDAGHAAIGWGHQIKPGDGIGNTIDAGTAEALFQSDIEDAARTINSAVKVELTQRQFDALADLVFNIGPTNFLHGGPNHGPSTILVMLNAGNFAGAAGQFQRWIYSQGRVNTTLVGRRAREAQRFATASGAQS